MHAPDRGTDMKRESVSPGPGMQVVKWNLSLAADASSVCIRLRIPASSTEPPTPVTLRTAILALVTALTACSAAEPTAPPTAGPTVAATTIEPSAFGWRMVMPELDGRSVVIGYRLRLGLLDSPEPLAEVRLGALPPWPFELAAERRPVVIGPAGGLVTYVVDDGGSSELRTVGIGVDERVVARIPEVIFSATLDRARDVTYATLLDRQTGADLGVFRVNLATVEPPVRVMPPAVFDEPEADTNVVLAAVSRFVNVLRVSSTEHQLARFACGGVFGGCVVDMLDLDSGVIQTFRREVPTEFIGFGEGLIFGDTDCRGAVCTVRRALDVRTGTFVPVAEAEAGDSVAIDHQGRLVHLGVFGSPESGEMELRATVVATGAVRELVTIDGQVVLGTGYPEIEAELPRGFALVRLCPPELPCTATAMNVTDGSWVEVRLPELIAIGGGHD